MYHSFKYCISIFLLQLMLCLSLWWIMFSWAFFVIRLGLVFCLRLVNPAITLMAFSFSASSCIPCGTWVAEQLEQLDLYLTRLSAMLQCLAFCGQWCNLFPTVSVEEKIQLIGIKYCCIVLQGSCSKASFLVVVLPPVK